MLDQISIHGLLVPTLIGVNEEERNHPQDIRFDLDLFLSCTKAARSDQLTDTIDYNSFCESLTTYVQKTSFYLLEAMVEDLAQYIFMHFKVDKLSLRATKKPMDMPNVDCVSFTIERRQQDFK